MKINKFIRIIYEKSSTIFLQIVLVLIGNGALAFFTGLYQAFKLLGYVGQDKVFSKRSVKALRTIKYCAMVIIAFIVVPEVYLFIARPGDDIAGGMAMGFIIIFVSIVIAVTAAIFERLLQKAVELKSEYDLTV